MEWWTPEWLQTACWPHTTQSWAGLCSTQIGIGTLFSTMVSTSSYKTLMGSSKEQPQEVEGAAWAGTSSVRWSSLRTPIGGVWYSLSEAYSNCCPQLVPLPLPLPTLLLPPYQHNNRGNSPSLPLWNEVPWQYPPMTKCDHPWCEPQGPMS